MKWILCSMLLILAPCHGFAKNTCESSFSDNLNPDLDYHHITKSLLTLLETNLAWPTLAEVVEFSGIAAKDVSQAIRNRAAAWKLLAEWQPTALEKFRQKIMKAYVTAARGYGRTLSMAELAEALELDIKGLRSLFHEKGVFTDLTDLKRQARNSSIKAFDEILDADIFNEERNAKFLAAITKHKRLVVTTAVSGAEVDQDFLAAIETYCQANDAVLVIIPANMTTNELDESLLDKPWIHVLTNETELTKYLRISNIKIAAKQFNPLTSLDNFGPRSQSVIVGSPKMHMKVVPTVDNELHPHVLISTGAITKPNYSGRKFIQKRSDAIATKQHRMGAVVIERISGNALKETAVDGDYHVRHIEYMATSKAFYDTGYTYSKDGIFEERPAAMVLGDLHVAKLDRKVFEQVKQDILKYRPRKIVLHDILDGHTINHHAANKLLSRAKDANEGLYKLADELRDVVTVLNELLAISEDAELLVVRSNHDMWLDKWLESGAFMSDEPNQAIGLLLASAMHIHGVDNPLEYAIMNLGESSEAQKVYSAKVADKSRVRFLATGESYWLDTKVHNVQLGMHGHAGANGSRTLNVKGMQRSAGRGVLAHTHTVARENDAVNVGVLAQLVQPYNRDGASNWVQSYALVGPNGEIQVLSHKGGEFIAEDGNRKTRGFFPPAYPFLQPNTEVRSAAGQVDQYGE